MKDLATVVVIAVSAIILLLVSSGDGHCAGDKELGDNSTCSNRTDFVTFLCRLKCIFCYSGNVSHPFGCITEGQNGTCLCLQSESGGGNGTAPGEPTTPSFSETTPLPGAGGEGSGESPSPSPPG